MADTTIAMTRPKWVVDTIRSREVTVKAASATIEALAGHLVFKQADGSYKAYATSTTSATIKDSTYVGVLAEPASITVAGVTVRVIEAGIVYLNAVRDAGIASSAITDEEIRNYSANLSAIVFDDYKKEEM